MSPVEPKQKLSELISFLNQQLRPHCSWTIQEEYPQVFQEKNFHNLKYIEKNGRVVTHAALKPLIIKTPHMIFKVGAVGSVVTDPSYRRQGLSSEVLLQCLDEAENQDCDLAILWSDLHNFYRKFGFEPASYEEHFSITKPLTNPVSGTQGTLPSLKFLTSNSVDPEALLRVYNKHSITSVRTLEDIKGYLLIPNTELYTAWDPQTHQLKAYAVIGKGADLQGFAHEWGGDIPDLFALFNFILQSKKQPFNLLAGAHSVNLIIALQKQKHVGQQGFLGLIKILNPEKFGEKLQKWVAQYGYQKFQILQLEGGKILVTLDHHEFLLPNESHLVKLIFGPTPPFITPRPLKTSTSTSTATSTSASALPPETLAAPITRATLGTRATLTSPAQNQAQGQAAQIQILNQLFPLPFWIWGWDSV
jgi:N-acetylglutamate synthase-like GNAT family acetyltransferase